MLAAGGIAVRNPDGRQAQHIGKAVVRQRSAEVWQNMRFGACRGFKGPGGKAHPRVVRIKPGRREGVAFGLDDLNLVKALGGEMTTQGRDDVVRVGANDETQLAGGLGIAGDGVDRRFRHAGFHGQHGKAVPAEYPFLWCQALLAPVLVDLDGAGVDRGKRCEYFADARGEAGGAPFGDLDLAACIGDRGNGVRQNDRRVGDEAAEVARVVGAFPEVNHHVEQLATARAGEDGRSRRGQTRAVRGDQNVGGKQVLVLFTEGLEPRRPTFLGHFQKDLGIEAKFALSFDDGGHGLDVDEMLGLVVGSATAIEPVAFFHHLERGEAFAPLGFLGADDIAVAIAQNRWQSRILDAFGDHDRGSIFLRVVEDCAGETQAFQHRLHLVGEIGHEMRLAARVLTLGRAGDQSLDVREKASLVEIAGADGQSLGAITHLFASLFLFSVWAGIGQWRGSQVNP